MPEPTMNPRLDVLLSRAADEAATEEEWRELESLLAADPAARRRYVQMMDLHAELRARHARTSSPETTQSLPKSRARFPWLTWRPLAAAAAGIVFGMLCTSVVFGFATQRTGVKQTPMVVFDPGLENEQQTLENGLPERAGQWGRDAAKVVSAEAGVKPLQGRRMLRLEPIAREKTVTNHTSRAYQLLDLRSLPSIQGETEVEVAASFCATNSDASSRYMIRAIALDEPTELATKNFWSKVESDGVVSESQRFDTSLGDSGWHTFSMKLRLPPGSNTLVLIFGAVPPEDTSRPALVHYLDEVQVSLLTPQPLP
jgi:hypothetical protein